MNNSPRPPKETHSLSLDPVIWKWLTELAIRDYDGNISAAVTGLALYDRGIAKAKLLNGETPKHHLTVGIPQDPNLLASAIMEIEGLDPGFNAKTWIEFERERGKNGR